MITDYKDSTGKVFPLNMSGKPQGYFDGNKFVFPQFKRSSAAVIPAVDPVMPIGQQPDYFRLPANTQELSDQGGGDVMTVDDFNDTNDINQDTSRYGETDNPPGMFGSDTNLGISAPRGYTAAGELIGGMFGPFGSMAGGALGGAVGGRGNQGIGGNAIGSLLGFAFGGPVGMALGGLLGGGYGDARDYAALDVTPIQSALDEIEDKNPFERIADAMVGGGGDDNFGVGDNVGDFGFDYA